MSEELWYGVKGQERICETIDDLLDGFPEGTPVEVHVFRKCKVNRVETIAFAVLDRLLEDLDDDYGDPDGDLTEPTDGMKWAAKVFIDAVLKEYVVWTCEPTGEVIKAVAGEENHE